MKKEKIALLKGKLVRIRPVTKEILHSRYKITDDIWSVTDVTDSELILSNTRNGLEKNIKFSDIESFEENGVHLNLTRSHYVLNLKVQLTIVENKAIEIGHLLAGIRRSQSGRQDHPKRRLNRH